MWIMARKIDDRILDELLKGCERRRELLGEDGLTKGIKRALMQRMLWAELTEQRVRASRRGITQRGQQA